MGLSKEGFDILQAPDKAETGKSSGDPIMSKLKGTLLNGKEKYDGSKGKAITILAEITRIGECLTGVSPIYFDIAIQLVKHVRRMYSYVNDFENKTGFIPTLAHKFSAKMHYAVALTSSQSSFYHLIAYSFYYDFSFTFIYDDPVYFLFNFLLARRK